MPALGYILLKLYTHIILMKGDGFMISEIWKPLKHSVIKNDAYLVSSYGRIKPIDDTDWSDEEFDKQLYLSSNGYNYYPFIILKDGHQSSMMFPIDEIVAETFMPIDDAFIGKSITVKHKDGNTRNDNVKNLEWIEELETWKPVILDLLDPEKYLVSNFGGIKHVKSGHTSYTTKINSRGYCAFSFTGTDGKQHNTTKHKIVALAFVDGYDEYLHNEVNHIDGVKTNNYWKNLEWVDHDGNMKHAFNNQMVDSAKGDDCHLTNMTNYEAHLISALLLKCWGKSTAVHDMVKKMGFNDITLKQIQHIKHKEGWNWLSDNYWTKEILDKLSIAKIHLISATLKNFDGDVNKTHDALSILIPGLTKRFIQIIKYKESHSDISDIYFTKDSFK